jgi:hypothetical protein
MEVMVSSAWPMRLDMPVARAAPQDHLGARQDDRPHDHYLSGRGFHVAHDAAFGIAEGARDAEPVERVEIQAAGPDRLQRR